MKRRRNTIIGAAVFIGLVAFGLFRVFGGAKEAVSYETRPTVSAENPQIGDIFLYTDLIGTVQPQTKAAVMPKIGGEVLEVNFQAGDKVESGQQLIKINSDALTSLKIQMEAAQISAQEAARELSRIQPLYEQGFLSQQAYEQAGNQAKSASLSYEAAKNQYELQLQYTTVTAPISGVVESREVKPHDHISANTQICTISANSQFQIEFGVSELTYANLSVGDSIEMEKDGKIYTGQVSEISAMVNAATGLYDVKAAIPQTGSLTTASRVKLKVIMAQATGALTVPVSAVYYDNGTPFVYCYENNTAVKTTFEAGIYDSDRMEVISGLSPEALVITSWSNELFDGAAVILADTGKEAVMSE